MADHEYVDNNSPAPAATRSESATPRKRSYTVVLLGGKAISVLETSRFPRSLHGETRLHILLRRGIPIAAVGLMVVFGAVATAAGWADWSVVGGWLRPRIGWLVFGAAGVLLVTAVARAGSRRRPARLAAPTLGWWMIAAVVVVATVAWGATTWLLREADRAADPAAARVEAIKVGLSISAGIGGVFALLLAVRRQQHQEVHSAAVEQDAAEKRITELYTKAADQLGSDRAPVRLAGLYALERVAQDNPTQRQTIVNVVCAYLRMPYQLAGEPPIEGADDVTIAVHRERVQERQVRLTAQRMLGDHLRPGDQRTANSAFWNDISLDLTEAILIDFTLVNSVVYEARFAGATFVGPTDFESTTFKELAIFRASTFTGAADFAEVNFVIGADFRSANFNDPSSFESAYFATANFESVTFTGLTSFRSTNFFGQRYSPGVGPPYTDFTSATFKRGVPAELARFVEPSATATE